MKLIGGLIYAFLGLLHFLFLNLDFLLLSVGRAVSGIPEDEIEGTRRCGFLAARKVPFHQLGAFGQRAFHALKCRVRYVGVALCLVIGFH